MGLIASNSGLPLALSSRPACGLLTIDTTATPPELEAAFLGAHSASWKRRPKCPPASAGRSTSIYILALVPTVHDVIHGPGIFNAQLARHGQPLPTRPRGVNSDTCRGLRKPLPSICDIAFAARRPFNPTGSTRCAGGDYTTSMGHSCAGLATPAKAVSGLNRRNSIPDSSTLGSRVKRSSTHHLKAVAQNRHPVFQPTLVRGCREPAASALLEQPRQMPSAAHVQSRRDPGQGHGGLGAQLPG